MILVTLTRRLVGLLAALLPLPVQLLVVAPQVAAKRYRR